MLFQVAKHLIGRTRTVFKIRYGSQPWIEQSCGGQMDGQSLETWRQRCLALVKEQLGDWEPEQTQPTSTNQ
jgi:hypothetical protein